MMNEAGIGIPPGTATSGNSYNSLTSFAPASPVSEVPESPASLNPAEQAIQEFGPILASWERFADSFPNVAQTEKQEVVEAMARCLDKLISSMGSSGGGIGGGESSY